MEKRALGLCPVCTNKLIVTELTCKNCNLQLKGEFSLNKYSYLTKEESKFLETFLQTEGSFKTVQERLGITYIKAKENLANVLDKLDIKKINDEGNKFIDTRKPVIHVDINQDDHFVTKLIKEKLNNSGGQAEIPLIQEGKKIAIEFESDGSGIVCDKIPIPNQLKWDAFIAAYNILIMNEGELYKGYARSGKLGSERLPIDSLEGYIAYAVHGVKEGDSAFAPGFVIAAILDWIGILNNERGTFLQAQESMITVESYEKALENAKVFLKELPSSQLLQNRLSYFRHWYYFEEIDGFAPSKFIGYRGMDSRTYEAYAALEKTTDGRKAERALRKFFNETSGFDKDRLMGKLWKEVDKYGANLNVEATIYTRR